jgi:hypothetical protein
MPAGELLDELATVLQYKRRVIHTPGRLKKLAQRLKSFKEAELVLAARAIVDNDYMMGDNPNRVKYATVDYLIRSDEIVEKWLEAADESTQGINLTELQF